jgi:predicted amidophosphoribosyltransferase
VEVAVLLFALLLFLLAVLIVARIIRGAIHFASTKRCPHCAERVKIDANVCKHCGRDVAGA